MSTVTAIGPAAQARSRPARVARVAWSAPEACISSQATQRAALPQAETSPRSAFQMRIKASPSAEAAMAISWSQPIPPSPRRAMARTSSGLGSKALDRASTTTKSLPSPFIFTKGRDMRGRI